MIAGLFLLEAGGMGTVQSQELQGQAHSEGIEVEIRFEDEEGGRLAVVPLARGPASEDVRYMLRVSAKGPSGRTSTEQSGQARISAEEWTQLSVLHLRQDGGTRYEARLSVRSLEQDEVREAEAAYERP